MYVVSFDGSAWGTPVEIPGQAGQPNYYKMEDAFVDSAGFLHIIVGFNTGALYHIAMDSGGSFGSLQLVEDNLENGTQGDSDVSEFAEFNGSIGFLAIGFDAGNQKGDLNLYYATPSGVLNPTWQPAALITNNDAFVPLLPTFTFPPKITALTVHSGSLYAIWGFNDNYLSPVFDPPNGRYYYSKAPVTTPTSWNSPTLIWTNASGVNYAAYQVLVGESPAGIGIIGVSIDNFGGATDDDELGEFNVVGATVAAVPYLPMPQGGPGCLMPKNHWDLCGEEEMRKMLRIRIPGFCTIPERYKNLLPWEDDFGAVPFQSKVINQAKGIVTPAPAAGDQVMLQYQVPHGYFGFLSGFFFQYSGIGFVPGSGDIIFRIRLNQRYLKDLSNVLFALGSTRFPVPMTQGQVLLSDQVIQAIVNVPNLSGLIQVGSSTCYAGLFGFLWPYG